MPQISKKRRDVLFDEDLKINDLQMSLIGQRPTSCHKTMLDDFKVLCPTCIAKNASKTEKYVIFFNSDIVKIVENIAEFISNIYSSQFPVNEIQTTKEELLYGFLGFLPKLAQGIQCLDEYDKNHKNISYYIQKWVKSYICGQLEIFKDIKTYVHGEKLEKALKALTFSTEMEGITDPTIDPDFQKTQSAKSWVFKYINHVISSHKLLSKDACGGYQTGKRDVWFTETIVRGCEPQRNPRLQRKIHMINISVNAFFNDEDIKRRCKPGTDLWYHGTPLFDSADSILKDGIDVTKGSIDCDFSSESGFYVSNSYEQAKVWATRFGPRCAIVVFQMNIESSQWNVLDIKDNETWRKVIRYYRSDQETQEELKFVILKENVEIELPVDDLDCIKGYICSKPYLYENNTYRGRDFVCDGKIPVTQICVRKPQLATHFGSLGNICAVIWFSRN